MLSDFFRTLVDFVAFWWPLHIVPPWERSIRVTCGRQYREVGPGMYWKLPWFMTFHDHTVVAQTVTTGRIDVPLKDGRLLSFEASCLYTIRDIRRAVVDTHDCDMAMLVMLASVLAERFTDEDPGRFDPSRRARLNNSIKDWVQKEAEQFGVEVQWVRLTSFVINPRTHRLLMEQLSHIG